MQDDKHNRYIKCPVCGAIGNWHDYINGSFCHEKTINISQQSNEQVTKEDEEEEGFTPEELEEIMEEYRGVW